MFAISQFFQIALFVISEYFWNRSTLKIETGRGIPILLPTMVLLNINKNYGTVKQTWFMSIFNPGTFFDAHRRTEQLNPVL